MKKLFLVGEAEVKNTFLDDVVREQSSNESTLAEAQTCPVFSAPNDGLSLGSSASHSGSAGASVTQSDGVDTANLEMPNTLQTLSTPPCTLRYLPAVGEDFTEVLPHTMPMDTLELWPEVRSVEGQDLARPQDAQLLRALQAMPNAPFRDFLVPKIHGGLDANLGAVAGFAPPNLPHVPWAPPVLSTIPPAQNAKEFLAPVGQEACDDEVGEVRESGENEIQLEAACGDVTAEGAGKEKKNKKKNVSKIWCHFYLEPTMLRSGFDVNKKIIGHGGTNTKRAKIRLRGRGSGHCEGERGEAPVTSDTRNQENFVHALEMSAQLLQTVTSKFPDYCRNHAQNATVLQPLFWIGDASQDALASLEHVSGSQVLIGKTEVTLSLDAGSGGVRSSRRGY
eukprot:Skav223161  [mRNA]  locus=scaffold3747:19709:23234:+ [translate_table: standard]